METAQYRSGGNDFDAKQAGLSLTHRPQYALTLQSYYFYCINKKIMTRFILLAKYRESEYQT